MSTTGALVELARYDARLFQLQQQIQTLPGRISDLDRERVDRERQIREAEAHFEKAEKARRKFERELEEFRQKHVRSQKRLMSLTSTQEYQALVREMEIQSERIDTLETEILEALEIAEKARVQRDAENQRLTQAIGILDERQEKLRADLETARAGLSEAKSRRDQAATAVDGPTRALYERILRAKGDAALSLVSGHTCSICKAVQTPQVLQMLRQSRGNHNCQMCGRILIWDPGSP